MIKKYDMKRISKIMLFLFLSASTLTGCDDLLEVDSNRLVFVDDYDMTSANDTLYSMFGIFSQLQKLSDSYVLLGELRGDLMDVSENSGLYLKEINDFNISGKNPYTNNIKDYYAVINNCNYVIQTIDTSIVSGGNKVMYKEYAASKAIRAWTYMQIALNYGSATYFEKPILNVEDAKQVYPEYTMEELAPKLIEDLSPYKDIEEPSLGGLYSYNTSDSYFPIRFLLGDLYLWLGQYENAANEYHDLMFKRGYGIFNNIYENNLQVTNGAFTGAYVLWGIGLNGWMGIFDDSSLEDITSIAATNDYGQQFDLDSLVLNNMVTPSALAINKWDTQKYYHSTSLDTLGDLRKYGSVSNSPLTASRFITQTTAATKKDYIYKYILMNPISVDKKTSKRIMPYRTALLYLRYAEAVNRMGKPNLAFAVIKTGLSKLSMQNKKVIPQHELSDPLPNYMDFTDLRFDTSIGIRMRGLGNVDKDSTFAIPALPALADSILYVEDMIQNELALETAFEGNRFQDLMRMAIHRDDNNYLAEKVAAKHKSNKEAIKSKLLVRANWYLKK